MARDEILGAHRFEHGQWRDPSSRNGSPPSPTNADTEKVEQIHSGHFMISNPHRIKKHGYNFEDAVKSPLTNYRFGVGEHESFEIDGSFAKLFQCLSLAYNGAAIVSPKWKTFKGMKLSWKDKIRLNNAIWREWHCQFVFGRKPILCQFSFPITDMVHCSPQAVVLEGKYWKRTLGTVVKEYMKWRAFYKKRRTSSSFAADGLSEPDQLLQEILGRAQQSPDPVPMVLDEEALLSEFTDTLFTSLDSKFLFPNPRELSHMSTNADIMQPGLVQLQPSLEELMDTFEPLQGWMLEMGSSDVMKSAAQSLNHTPSTFVFTGNNSLRPVVQAAQLSFGGASTSAVHDVTPPQTPSVQMPQQNLLNSMTLQDDTLRSDQPMAEQQQQGQQIMDMQEQPHQFNTQQQISGNQQLESQQFIITQQGLQTQDQQQQQQPMAAQDINSQLIATQQQLQEVSRQMSAAQQQLNSQQQSAVNHQFNTQQLQQQQQQIQLMQQQQQQLVLQQQTQQNQLQNLGIPLNSVGHPATLHSATGDTTHILLNNADLANIQSHINSGNGISQLQSNTQHQPMQGISAQQVLNPLTSVQVRIAPGDDVKVGTPIHQLAPQNQIQHVQQQQHRTLGSQSGVTVRTVNQAQNVAGTLGSSGQSTQIQGLPTLLSTGGNQTQAIKLLQQVANQVSQSSQQQPQQQQQQGVAVQQTDNKTIMAQIFDQNMIPTGNTSFVSVQQPIQQQQHHQRPLQQQQQPCQQQQARQQQQPIPVQITKAAPPAKTRTAQAVTKNQLVTSVAKVPSPTKPASGTGNMMLPGAKPKPRRQPKPKQAKIAPAPPSSTSTNTITATSSTALLTQLLTQGRFESALRASSAPQPIKPLPAATTSSIPGSAVLIQPIKTEFKTATTVPVAISVTSSLPGGVPFIEVSKSSSLFSASPASTSTTNSMSILGISSVLSSTPSKSDESKPGFTIGMVSSPPSSSSAGEGDLTPMEKIEMMEKRASSQTPKKDTHISAEQKRRVNIKSGFDMLQALVPSLSQNPNAKVSKAQMLQKAVEYTKKLQVERSHVNEEIDKLKQEVAGLNVAISETQSQLPASGVPVTRQRFDMMKDIFDEYVRDRTTQNWKFWIFSIIIRPLFESYNASVSTANTEELFRTVLAWLDQHCSLLALRPTVLSSLTLLSRTTSILSDPGQVPQQAAEAVSKRSDDNQKR